MSKSPKIGEAGSKLQTEIEQDHGLAERYMAEANAADLFALYEKRCRQLEDFGETLSTMAEMYAGKGDRSNLAKSTPDAVAAMERVALAAIDLAKSISGKGGK